jgi:hypothetical protein
MGGGRRFGAGIRFVSGVGSFAMSRDDAGRRINIKMSLAHDQVAEELTGPFFSSHLGKVSLTSRSIGINDRYKLNALL